MSVISLINAFPIGHPAEKGYWLYKNIPQALLKSMENQNFIGTVRFCAQHSPFYKRKFKELGIDAASIKTPEDLKDFFTTPEDIRQNPEEFICLAADTAYETTGTTSKKSKRVYFSRQEVREAGWAGAVGLWGVGVRPQDRVASAFDYSFWVSGPVLQASCEVLGCFHVEAGRLDPADFYERLSDYKLSVIVGDPSWVVRLTEIAEKKLTWPLKLILASGENLTEDARAYVERIWKCPFLLSYGQTEAFGAIGMESLAKEGYHLNEFHNRFEIINTDSQGYGELVYTTLNRRTMPLVRYRSGDITRFIKTPSQSGMPGDRIEKLKGRIDEWTVTGMGNIAPWMFETLFSKIEGISSDWQILVEKEGLKDKITFQFESENNSSNHSFKESVTKNFEQKFPDAFKMAAMGLVQVDIRILEKGTLRQGRKLKRIVDMRKF